MNLIKLKNKKERFSNKKDWVKNILMPNLKSMKVHYLDHRFKRRNTFKTSKQLFQIWTQIVWDGWNSFKLWELLINEIRMSCLSKMIKNLVWILILKTTRLFNMRWIIWIVMNNRLNKQLFLSRKCNSHILMFKVFWVEVNWKIKIFQNGTRKAYLEVKIHNKILMVLKNLDTKADKKSNLNRQINSWKVTCPLTQLSVRVKY